MNTIQKVATPLQPDNNITGYSDSKLAQVYFQLGALTRGRLFNSTAQHAGESDFTACAGTKHPEPSNECAPLIESQRLVEGLWLLPRCCAGGRSQQLEIKEAERGGNDKRQLVAKELCRSPWPRLWFLQRGRKWLSDSG